LGHLRQPDPARLLDLQSGLGIEARLSRAPLAPPGSWRRSDAACIKARGFWIQAFSFEAPGAACIHQTTKPTVLQLAPVPASSNTTPAARWPQPANASRDRANGGLKLRNRFGHRSEHVWDRFVPAAHALQKLVGVNER